MSDSLWRDWAFILGPRSPQGVHPIHRHAQHPHLHNLQRAHPQCHRPSLRRESHRDCRSPDRHRTDREQDPAQRARDKDLLRRVERLGSGARPRRAGRRAAVHPIRRSGRCGVAERVHPPEQMGRDGQHRADSQCHQSPDDD